MQMSPSDWSICTSPVWALLLLLCCLGHTEPFDFTKCDITDNFRSDFVSASFKSLDPGQGCRTSGLTVKGQEVHLISVNPTLTDDQGLPVVKLSIHSRRQANLEDMGGVHLQEGPGAAIFVLHTPGPAKWKVDMYGLGGQEKHVFVLSKQSTIRFPRKRTRMMTKTRKRLLPFSTDPSAIYQWTLRKFGAVTSYSVSPELNLKFYIGRDVNGSATCNLTSLSSSLHLFSYHEKSVPMQGCISKRRNNYARTRPVYIIELLEPPGPSPGMSGVDLEIMPFLDSGQNTKVKASSGDVNLDWNFYLVVKSPPGLTWTLHSATIAGWIDIVADAAADVKVTGVKISTVALRAEDMTKLSGRQLVEWSQDYIAPVQMYAGIRAANTITLRVPIEKNLASTRDRVTTKDPVNPQKNDPEVPWEPEESGKVNKYGHLGSLVQTTCTNHTMEVTVSKKIFQLTGLDQSKVSFRDLSCRPIQETADDIHLCTELTQCGTLSVGVDDLITFSNAVVIQILPGLISSALQDEFGSGFFEEEHGSASHDLSLHTDDEDYRSNPISISVECKLSAATLSQGAISRPQAGQMCLQRQQKPPPKCSLNIYSTPLFLRARTEFPATVTKDSYLYVIASITGQDVSLQADFCWFSTSNQPYDRAAQVKTLVARGCPKDSSLNWIQEPFVAMQGSSQPNNLKFRIKITDIFDGQAGFYLHCQFKACDANHQCGSDQEASCPQNLPAVLSSLPTPDCGPLTVGPLELTDKEVTVKPQISISTGTKSATHREDDPHGQQQRVIVEGLDSATVVGIAFAAFAIGILLTGALWFIHSHIGPVKRAVATHRDADASGDLTPNSSSPMTA